MTIAETTSQPNGQPANPPPSHTRPRLLLFTGFLGSGKTTLISTLVRLCHARGIKAAVIANDQGSLLVDAQYFASLETNTQMVSGGCFCCNMSSFVQTIHTICSSDPPDLIFAEAVGSCTDITATVINPLIALHAELVQVAGFLTLVDAPRLMGEYLQLNLEHPVSPREVLLQHQMREAGAILLTKSDLISQEQHTAGLARLNALLPTTPVFPGDSRSSGFGEDLLDQLLEDRLPVAREVVEIDYHVYTQAEQELAWVDGSATAEGTQDELIAKAEAFLDALSLALGLRLAHAKLFLFRDDLALKISCVGSRIGIDGSWSSEPESRGWAQVVINVRAQEEAPALEDLVVRCAGSLQIGSIRSFVPGEPKPEHHMGPDGLNA